MRHCDETKKTEKGKAMHGAGFDQLSSYTGLARTRSEEFEYVRRETDIPVCLPNPTSNRKIEPRNVTTRTGRNACITFRPSIHSAPMVESRGGFG